MLVSSVVHSDMRPSQFNSVFRFSQRLDTTKLRASLTKSRPPTNQAEALLPAASASAPSILRRVDLGLQGLLVLAGLQDFVGPTFPAPFLDSKVNVS